jgi:hypothetical protein
MKTRISLCLLFCMALSSAVFADFIYLKNGTTLSGKILRVTDTAVEYDPDGDIPFDAVKRSDVEKIVYPDGKSVTLTDPSSQKPAQQQTAAPAVNNDQASGENVKKDPGDYTHDGFYFRPMIGYAVLYSSVESKYGKIKMNGAGYAMSIDLGYAVVENVIPFCGLRLSVGTCSNTSFQNKDYAYNDSKQMMSDFGLGIGLCVYVPGTNLYFAGAYYSHDTAYSGNIVTDTTKPGKAFSGTIGYEAWLSENWSIGFALFCYSGTATMENDPDNNIKNSYNIFNKTRYTDFGIAITCTYN